MLYIHQRTGVVDQRTVLPKRISEHLNTAIVRFVRTEGYPEFERSLSKNKTNIEQAPSLVKFALCTWICCRETAE